MKLTKLTKNKEIKTALNRLTKSDRSAFKIEWRNLVRELKSTVIGKSFQQLTTRSLKNFDRTSAEQRSRLVH